MCRSKFILYKLIDKTLIINLSLCIFIATCIACTKTDPGPGEKEVCEGYPAIEESEYVLPFPVGISYKVKQQNCGWITHNGNLRYAYDFYVEIGDEVTAAQSGTVMFIKEDGLDTDTKHEDANFLVIKHEDNTIGRYRHLTHNGVLVSLGDVVARGQTIAFSGSSGVPAGVPTLHFDVMKPNSDGTWNTTIPITFINADPPAPTATGLNVNTTYTALAY